MPKFAKRLGFGGKKVNREVSDPDLDPVGMDPEVRHRCTVARRRGGAARWPDLAALAGAWEAEAGRRGGAARAPRGLHGGEGRRGRRCGGVRRRRRRSVREAAVGVELAGGGGGRRGKGRRRRGRQPLARARARAGRPRARRASAMWASGRKMAVCHVAVAARVGHVRPGDFCPAAERERG